MRFALLVLALVATASFASAQTPAGQGDQPAATSGQTQPAAPAPSAQPADKQDEGMRPRRQRMRGADRGPRSGKRAECRNEARTKGMRGDERRDFTQVCVLEARLACLKDAISKRVYGRARRDHIRQCMG
jgi:hypothetical protein